ncbi:BsuPI-related putative proteinase inhibitor [Aneurinibacillus sp. UBA3580]|jgi:hypothetical protein|uniref:BsuPI-related putative proteinase inhibitor n=1 Tax=Aneurinibacillus sp. UBA3580 TaxID=1946041 RepID=UPI00257FB594|nr:BsuPI-related putative proteinase inhibitor [Aneurinibacillus sp. UBA3580]
MKRVNLKSMAIGLAMGSVMTAGISYAAPALTQILVDVTPVTIKVGQETKSGTFNNGEENVPVSMIYNGTTYVPIRFISEALGKEVGWEQESRTITITDKGKDQIWAGAIESTLAYDGKGSLVFTVKNQTERQQALRFNTSQRYDYIIWNDKGEKVQHYSIDKLFAQEVSWETLKQGEEKTFTAPLKGLKKGNYKVEFWLTTESAKIHETAFFQLLQDI